MIGKMKIKTYTNSRQRIRDIFDWHCDLNIPASKTVTVIKARDGSNLVGSCYVEAGMIKCLVVNPKYRGKGYGKKLIRTAEKVMKQQGLKVCQIIPQDNEPKLRKYYSSLGYKGFSPDTLGYEEEDKTWWVMEKII